MPADQSEHRATAATAIAADGPEAAQKALNAGTDMEMVSTNFRDFGAQLVASHRVQMSRINDAVRRILRIKFRAGLFDHPYVDVAQAGAEAAAAAQPGARPLGCGSLDGAAEERRQRAAVQPR